MPAFTFCSFRLGASNAPGTFRRPEAGIALAGCTLRDRRVATRAEQYAIRPKGGPNSVGALLRRPAGRIMRLPYFDIHAGVEEGRSRGASFESRIPGRRTPRWIDAPAGCSHC